MAQVITLVCDAHMLQDKEVPGETVRLSFGAEPYEMDLCQPCMLEHVMPLQALARKVGRTPERAAKPQRDRQQRDRERKCFLCPHEGTESVINRHLKAAHKVTVPEVYGQRCPLCGKPFARPSALGVHSWKSHNIRSLPFVFAEALELGDPHGVYAERLEAVRELSAARLAEDVLSANESRG